MIYPAFQKAEIKGKLAFLPDEILVEGFDSDYAERFLNEFNHKVCKGNKLYIKINKENTRRTEYIEEARRFSEEKYFLVSEKRGEGIEITLTVSCRRGLFAALNRIKKMCGDGEFITGAVEDYPLFAVRGYIEGFYGKPWSAENRKMMLRLMASYGMNTYYYAPKDDPYHRDKWNELYPIRELDELSELAALCRENFVDFYYCIAPGMSMKYSSESDFEKLCCKVNQLYKSGVTDFGLLLDDIPENLWYDEDKATYDGEAVNAHIDLICRFRRYLEKLDRNCRLTVCPLQYHGRGDEYYISKLGKGIPADVSVFWTGGNICSQSLTVREAVIFENATNHMPLYWDNFPVNDAEMLNEMHIGYLDGRENELYRYSEGIVSNAMEYCLSSRIPLLTVCDYLWNPIAYDGFSSWQNACEIVLGDKKELLMPFLDNLLTSCLKVENSPMLNQTLNAAQQRLFSGDCGGAAKLLSEYISELKKCCDILKTLDTPMIKELEPWAEKQYIALELIENAAALIDSPKIDYRKKTAEILEKYLRHPKTLCNFSLQFFAERMIDYEKTE